MRSRIKNIIVGLLVIICSVNMVVNLFVLKDKSSKIRFAFWGTNMPYYNAIKEVAELYNQTQDKYEVEIQRQDAGNYRIWLSSQLAGGTVPEIVATNRVYANADAQNGYIYDLSKVLDKPNPYNENDEEKWFDTFTGTYLTQLEDPDVKGQYNCIPTSTVSVRFVINKEMFAKNNIEVPDANWDFNDFRRVCEKFEEKGITALEIANMRYIDYMVSWLHDVFLAQALYDDIKGWDVNTNGIVEAEEIAKLFLDDNIEKLNFEKNQGFREVMQFMKMWSKYWGEGFNSRQDPSEHFLRQDIPMFFCGSWGVAGIETTLANKNPDADQSDLYEKFDYVSLPIPRLTKEVKLSKTETFTFTSLKENIPFQELGEPSDCYCIPKAAEKNGKLDGAVDFLQFLTSRKTAKMMVDKAFVISVIEGVEVNDMMKDFLPPQNSETLKMRFGLQTLSDGTAEEYHFKQMQMYLSDGAGSIGLDTFCKNIQKKYIDVVSQLAEDNEWEW